MIHLNVFFGNGTFSYEGDYIPAEATRSRLTGSPPANWSPFGQKALAVPGEVVLQVLLFLGLGAELQVHVVGELGEITEALLSTAHTVP